MNLDVISGKIEASISVKNSILDDEHFTPKIVALVTNRLKSLRSGVKIIFAETVEVLATPSPLQGNSHNDFYLIKHLSRLWHLVQTT